MHQGINMKSSAAKTGISKMNAATILWATLLVAIFAAGPVLADEGVVQRTNLCRKGTIVIKTNGNEYVAAVREGMGSKRDTPWRDSKTSRCAFFPGDRVVGDLTGFGTTTLTNSTGQECDYEIEGHGYSMQTAEEILGCYQ